MLDNLIKELENILNSNFNKKNAEKSEIIINNIFEQVKSKDDLYHNFFLDELKINFKLYFINIFKNKIKKLNFNNNSILRNRFFVKKIDPYIVKKINKILNSELNKLLDKERNNLISRADLTYSGGLKIRKVINLLNNYFEKNGHLEVVSNYLGYKSEINALALELSSPRSNWWKHKKNSLEPKTLGVHLDKEFTCLKSILYLSDVKEENGPFTVYPGIYENLKLNIFQDILWRIILETANEIKNEKLKKYLNIKENSQPFLSENLQKIYSKLPKIISFNSHFGWELDSGSELEKKIVNSKNVFLGQSGTMITFDGSRILHSGGLVKENNRVVLQIIYSKKISFIKRYLKKFKRILIN